MQSIKGHPELDIKSNYDSLVMISGKLQSVVQDQKIGIIRADDAAMAKAQLR